MGRAIFVPSGRGADRPMRWRELPEALARRQARLRGAPDVPLGSDSMMKHGLREEAQGISRRELATLSAAIWWTYLGREGRSLRAFWKERRSAAIPFSTHPWNPSSIRCGAMLASSASWPSWLSPTVTQPVGPAHPRGHHRALLKRRRRVEPPRRSQRTSPRSRPPNSRHPLRIHCASAPNPRAQIPTR